MLAFYRLFSDANLFIFIMTFQMLVFSGPGVIIRIVNLVRKKVTYQKTGFLREECSLLSFISSLCSLDFLTDLEFLSAYYFSDFCQLYIFLSVILELFYHDFSCLIKWLSYALLRFITFHFCFVISLFLDYPGDTSNRAGKKRDRQGKMHLQP